MPQTPVAIVALFLTVDYTPGVARVHPPDRTVTREEPDLWDADTRDIRLGAVVAAGTTALDFTALDPSAPSRLRTER